MTCICINPLSGMAIVRQSAYLRPTDGRNTPQPFGQYALVSAHLFRKVPVNSHFALADSVNPERIFYRVVVKSQPDCPEVFYCRDRTCVVGQLSSCHFCFNRIYHACFEKWLSKLTSSVEVEDILVMKVVDTSGIGAG